MPAIATLTMNPALDVATGVEEVKPAHKLRCAAPRFDPGGGGINVARVVHALGGEVTAVFPAGGPTGATLRQLLDDSGLATVPIAIAGATRESLTVAEAKTGLQYRFVMPGPTLSAAEQSALLDALAALPGPPAYVVASGSLPPGCDPVLLRDLAARCRRLGARLVIDTSGPALAACEGARAWLIKPSLRELETLLGRRLANEGEEAAGARELIARGFAEAVVVSLAERGALLATRDGEMRFPAIEVRVVGTVGAGDSMVAAITLALARGSELAEAVRYGVAAGAAALTSGATELARPEDVERLYAGMKQAPALP